MDLRTTPRIQMTSGPVVMGPRAGGGGLEILWSVAGALTVGRSHEYEFTENRTLTAFLAHLDTAGTTPTVIAILNDEIEVATYTILANTKHLVLTGLEVPFAAGDRYRSKIKTAGSGAKDLQSQTLFV